MISVRFDTARLRLDMQQQKARLERTARRAVYELAFRARDAVVADMRRAFDRPTPWVLGGVQVAPAVNGATVEWKPGGGSKSVPASKILRAQVEGGARRLKRFERLIGLPANRVAVPGKWAELDQYGNISGAVITKILSDLRLFGEVGYVANRSLRRASRGSRRREQYFMIPVGSEHATLWPGIYRYADELGGAPLLIIAFVRAANYRQRINPAAVVQASVRREAGPVWALALQRGLPFRRIGR
jgi:hypothetical protein